MPQTLPQLANELRITAQHLSRRVRFEGTAEIAPHQFSVLVKLYHPERGPWTPGVLAQAERVSAPSMTRTVNGLVKAGLIDRGTDPDDARQRILTLTDRGREVVDRVVHDRDDWMLQRLDGLSDAEIATLAASVEILRKVLA